MYFIHQSIICIYILQKLCAIYILSVVNFVKFILGQFLHKEATVSDELLEINGRLIPIEKLPAWDFVHTNDTCLHAKPKHGFQAEGILEGKYTDYIVESLFSPYFYYSKFKL